MKRTLRCSAGWLLRRLFRVAWISGALALIGLAGSGRLFGADVVTEPLRTFVGRHGYPAITEVAFSTNGQQVLVGGRNDPWFVGYGEWEARVWGAETGELTNQYEAGGVLLAAHFKTGSPLVLLSIAAGEILRVWDLAGARLVREFRDTDYSSSPCYQGAISPDGQLVLTSYGLSAPAKLWALPSGDLLRSFRAGTGVVAVAFSDDRQHMVTGDADHAVRLWDLSTTNLLRTFRGHTDRVLAVAGSVDGRFVISGSGDRTARMWSVATGSLLWTLEGHTGAVQGVAMSPDGQLLLTGSEDGTARVWTATSGQLLRTFAPHATPVFSIAFSLDGRFVLTGHLDTSARLWSVAGLGERVGIAMVGPRAELRWGLGVLQEAGSLAGPWQDVPGAASPFQAELLGMQRFYRLRIEE